MTGRFTALVRHFIAAGLAPDVLTEVGRDYLRRVIFGVLAILLVLGSFLPRVFFYKYTALGAIVGKVAYLRALQADSLFMIAVPMVLIGLAAVIAGPMLFPDETDYNVLTPLPISRLQLFGAKLVAVAAIVAAAILAVNAVATFWFPLAVAGRKAEHSVLERVIAHGIGATAGSIFVCVAVMAVQGLTIVAVPASWQRRASVLVQGAIGVGLLLSLPIISRLPAMDIRDATIVTAPLVYLPPSWFFGVERWWLDGALAGSYVTVARIAATTTAIAAAIVVACYALLYRSAERLAGVSGANRRAPATSGPIARLAASRIPPQTLAIIDFVRAGIGRSRLHQFVFILAIAAGVAVLIGQVATANDAVSSLASRPRAAVQAVLAAPLLVALTFLLGLRSAYKWPLDRGGSWIFRLTEDARTRAEVLNGAAWPIVAGAWLAAMLAAIVVQPRVLGGSAWFAVMLTTLAVLALAELMLIDWRRVPFACSYLPGTRVLAYHLGVLFAYYFVFVIIGSNLIRWGIAGPARTVALGGFLLAGWAAVRRERLKTWGLLPLEFEDDDPAEVRVLRL